MSTSTQEFLLQCITENRRGGRRQVKQGQGKLKPSFLKMAQTTACVDADEKGTGERGKLTREKKKPRAARTVSSGTLNGRSLVTLGDLDWPLSWCSKAAITMYHERGGLNNGDLFSHSPRGWKSKTKVLSWLVPSEVSVRENLFPASALAAGGLLVPCHCWLLGTSPWSCLFVHMAFFLCVCL